MLDPQQLHDQLEQLARSKGISQWDLGATSSTDLSVQVDRGEPRQLKGAQRSAVTVRAWSTDGRVGITSSTDLSADGLALALSGAAEASAFGDLQEPPGLSCRSTEPTASIERPMREPQPIQQMLSMPFYHPVVDERLSSSSLYLYARAEQDGRKPRSAGAVRLARGSAELDVRGCIDEAAELTISHLDYAPIDTGSYTCVFSPDAFLDLIGAFSNIFNARAVLDGLSLSNRDSLGQQLAVPFLSLWDDARHPANLGASAFDGEGTPTARLPLIDGGVLSHFLHSEGTARQFGVAPTGHAGMGAKVSVGPDWFEVGATPGAGCGDSSLDRHRADGVVWIDSLSALHAGVKASQGAFSLPFDGWLLKGGERRSIEAATVAGDIRTVLRSIVALEGEPEVTPDGLCPHVWVEGLAITGEAE